MPPTTYPPARGLAIEDEGRRAMNPPGGAPSAARQLQELPQWSRDQMPYGEQMRSLGSAVASMPGKVGGAITTGLKHLVSAPGYGLNSDMRGTGAEASAAPSAPNPVDQRLTAGTQRTPLAAAALLRQPPTSTTAQVMPPAQAPQKPSFDFDTFQPQSGEGAFRNEQTGLVTRLQSEPVGARQQLAAPPRGLASYASEPQRQEVRAPVLNPNGGLFAAMVDFANQKASAVDAIAANKGMRNDRRDDLNELRTNADIAATAGRLALDGQRTGLDAQRVGLDAQRVAQGDAATRLASEEWGYTKRAKGLVQHMRDQVAAEPDQVKRRSLVQHMLDVEGRTQTADKNLSHNFMQRKIPVLDEKGRPTGAEQQEIVDLRTGRAVGAQPGQGGQGAQLPAGMTKQVGTAGGKPVYEDAQGKRFVGG